MKTLKSFTPDKNSITTMKTIKVNNTPEYLSKDILEEDFIKSFLIIYRLELLLGSCRVDAKNRFITTPTLIQKLYTVIVSLAVIAGNALIIYRFYPSVNDKTVYGLSVAAIIGHLLTYICNAIHVRFMNGAKNVEFHLKMQKIDRLMKIDKSKPIYKMLRGVNNISIILLFGAYVVIFIYALVKYDYDYAMFFSVVFGQFTYIVELINCSSIVIYYVIRLKFINAIVKNHLKSSAATGTETKVSKKYIRRLAMESHDFETSDTSVYLRELFHCFETFQELYRFQLFMFSLKLVIMSLIVFELLLFSIQKNKIYEMEIMSLILFTVIDIFIAIFLGYRYEMLYSEVKETKRLSIGVMAIHQTGHIREKARTMLKMIEETPPRFSIYDMWEMNAGIFLTIFSLVTSLIVTLLQFAFL